MLLKKTHYFPAAGINPSCVMNSRLSKKSLSSAIFPFDIFTNMTPSKTNRFGWPGMPKKFPVCVIVPDRHISIIYAGEKDLSIKIEFNCFW